MSDTWLRYFRGFLIISAVILLVTAAAKTAGSFGHASILEQKDPVFLVPNRMLLRLVALLEIGVVILLISRKDFRLKILGLTALTGCFAVYRVALSLMGDGQGCPCLGHLSGNLYLPPTVIDLMLQVSFYFILIGSYALLFAHLMLPPALRGLAEK